MAVAGGILLGLYLAGIVYALLAPVRQPDPQRGQAVGCLMIVAAGIALLGALLAVGSIFDVAWLVRGIFYVAVFPAVLLAVHALRYLWLRAAGAWRQT